jgi:hypothetical protein
MLPMRTNKRAAISQLATAAIAIVIVIGLVAVAFLAIGPAGVSSTSLSTSTGAPSKSPSSSSLSSSSVSTSTIVPSNSSSVGFSSKVSRSGSSTTSIIQSSSSSQTSVQYPLVWAQSDPIDGTCDIDSFCISATVGYAANSTIPIATSSTTIIEGNTTIIVHYGAVNTTTTIIRRVGYNETDVVVGPDNPNSRAIAVWVLVQNATTGKNLTSSSGSPIVLSATCLLEPTGLTRCHVAGYVSVGGPGLHPYSVTVFVTENLPPCSIAIATQVSDGECTSQLLAPPITANVSE